MLQCPFCLKPFKNYHSLQRLANRLSKTAADEGQHQWKLPRVEDITMLPNREHGTADEPERKKQVGHINCTTSAVLAQGSRFASVLQEHKGTVSLYRQQLATALVLCLVSVGQSDDPKQAALSVLHQLLRIEHDSLALDTVLATCFLFEQFLLLPESFQKQQELWYFGTLSSSSA